MRVDVERLARLLAVALQVEVTREDLDTAQIVSRNREKYIEVLSLHAVCIPTDYGGIVYSRPTRTLTIVGRGAIADISDVDERALDRVLWLLSRHAETGDPRYLAHALVELNLSPPDAERVLEVAGAMHPDASTALRAGVTPAEVIAERIARELEPVADREDIERIVRERVRREGDYAVETGVDERAIRLLRERRLLTIARKIVGSATEVETQHGRAVVAGRVTILRTDKSKILEMCPELSGARREPWEDFRRKLKYDRARGEYRVPRAEVALDRRVVRLLEKLRPREVLISGRLLAVVADEAVVMVQIT